MATKYIVTQLWSPRHIVTRGFGVFFDADFGQAEIIELGIARFGRILTTRANLSKQKDLIAQVLTSPSVTVER
jgi:hypothetical protein